MVDDPVDATKIFTPEELEEKFLNSQEVIVVRVCLDDDGAVEIFSQINRCIEDYPAGLKLEICECLKNAAIEILKWKIPEGETLQ